MEKETNFEQLKIIDLFGKRVNLRFQNNDYFKTYCGAFATITMFLALLVIFGLQTIDIINGKIDKLSYMIKSYDLEEMKNSNKEKIIEQQVFAFGMKEKYFDKGYLNYTVGMQKRGEQFISSNNVYECTEFVYKNLSERFVHEVPDQIKIFCYNITSEKIDDGFNPMIILTECKNETAGCYNKKRRDLLLSEFSIWTFVLSDETDFTKPITSLSQNFRATKISVSNSFKMESMSYLRELEIHVKKGLFLPKMQTINTYQYTNTRQHVLKLINTDVEDNVLLVHKIRLDRSMIIVITKEFKTLLDLLAYLGGVSKGIGILLLMMVVPVREVLFYRKLINHMFSVCVDEKQIQLALSMKMKGGGESHDDEHKGDGKGQSVDADNEQKFNRMKNRRQSKKLKSQLFQFKKMIKDEKDNKKNKGLIDVMAGGALTKEQILENLKEAFEAKGNDGTPKNFSSLVGIGMKKKILISL